jgi:hypothetical protein
MTETPETPESFTQLLDLLAGGKRRRGELAVMLGRKYWEVSYWTQKNSVPVAAWADIIKLAHKQGHAKIDDAFLLKLARKTTHEDSKQP